MRSNNYLLLFLFALSLGCSSSNSTDDPTPPTPTPDYSTCKYTLNYKLIYSPLNKNKPTTVTYLGSDQKVKTVTLADTSFSLTVDYKYGDSVYVKLSPNMYFANKPTPNILSTNNKLQCIYQYGNLTQSSSACSYVIDRNNNNSLTGSPSPKLSIPRDSITMVLYKIDPVRLAR